MENPGEGHWTALKCVFQYLKGTKEKWLVLGGNGKGLEGYSDADGMSTEGRRAISGYIFQLFGAPISWSSKRQDLVTLSTAEAEYVALTHAGKEAIWLSDVLSQTLKLNLRPITLYGDNNSSIAIAKDDVYHARTKHIDIYYHWIREKIADNTIHLQHVASENNLADILTKALSVAQVNRFANSVGLRA